MQAGKKLLPKRVSGVPVPTDFLFCPPYTYVYGFIILVLQCPLYKLFYIYLHLASRMTY